jgi:hypothetical protein
MQYILNALIFLLHELIENCNLFIVVTLMVSYYVTVTVIHLSEALATVQWFFFAHNLSFCACTSVCDAYFYYVYFNLCRNSSPVECCVAVIILLSCSCV